MSTLFRRSPTASQPNTFSDPFQQKKGWKPRVPAPAPLPYDPIYEGRLAQLSTQKSMGLADVAAGRETVQRNYGFNIDGTENSADPYSRLARLRADYEKVKRGANNNFAASGQLYAGSYQNQINDNQDANGYAYDQLRKDFQNQVAGLNRQESGINADYSQGVYTAGVDRYTNSLEDIATGAVAPPSRSTRMQAVLEALSKPKRWKTGHLAKLQKEARQNGWIR